MEVKERLRLHFDEYHSAGSSSRRGIIGGAAGCFPLIDFRQHRTQLIANDFKSFTAENQMLGRILRLHGLEDCFGGACRITRLRAAVASRLPPAGASRCIIVLNENGRLLQ